MAIGFPNPSRYFDEVRHAIGFWGHDGAMEAAFFVGEDGLKKIQPGLAADEAGMLSAFDANTDLIHAAAINLYRRGRQGSYDLRPSDF